MERVGRGRFFISYAHGVARDEELCLRFADALTRTGHDVFFDQAVTFGADWAEGIERQLGACDFFLFLRGVGYSF
jgi:hypothetical protein